MQNVVDFFQVGDGTNAAAVCLFVFVTVLLSCLIRRTWPDTNAFAVMFFGMIGTISGLKIIVLTITFPLGQLGALADNKAALLFGGTMTFLLSFRLFVEHWRKTVGLE